MNAITNITHGAAATMAKLGIPASAGDPYRSALQDIKGHLAQLDVPKAGLVGVLTASLADAMKEIHGGHWRFDIDHESGFVVVRCR